jgi:hypothetical protein
MTLADPFDPSVLRQSFKPGRHAFLGGWTERQAADWVRGRSGTTKQRARAFMMGFYCAQMMNKRYGEPRANVVWRVLSKTDLDEAIAQVIVLPDQEWNEDNTLKSPFRALSKCHARAITTMIDPLAH